MWSYSWQKSLFSYGKFVNLRLGDNRPFATNDHMVQNPTCLRASSLLFPHWDIKTKASQAWLVQVSFVLMSQWGNNNKLALQHGGFCTMWSSVAKGLLSRKCGLCVQKVEAICPELFACGANCPDTYRSHCNPSGLLWPESRLTLARLPGASEIYLWARKPTLRLARSGNQIFCSTDILRKDLICNEESDWQYDVVTANTIKKINK